MGDFMKIIVKYNNSFIELNTQSLKLIGQGYESKVYKYKDVALKIHHKHNYKFGIGLTLDNMKSMKEISTKRILMPIDAIYRKKANNQYIGYSTSLVTNIKSKYSFINLDSNILYNEIDNLREDAKKLSNHKIMLSDLCNDKNLVFNGNLYYVDPGCYYFLNDLDSKDINDENMFELDISLCENLFCFNNNIDYIRDELVLMQNINYRKINNKILELVNNIYNNDYENNYLKSGDKTYLEYLMNIIEKYETVSKYKYKLLTDFVNNSNNKSSDIKSLRKILK